MEKFERALLDTRRDPRVLVIRLRWVPFIDITGLHTLEEVLQHHRRGVKVLLAGANERVGAKLDRAGITELGGRATVFPELAQALEACRKPAATA